MEGRALRWAALLPVLLAFGLLQAVTYARVGGFEYPLDDVYIHLAMAEQIAAGGYGVNPGEYASAASSPFYPLLLVPFVGMSFASYVPLIVNLMALVVAAWLWGSLVLRSAAPPWLKLAIAVAGPLALNFAGVAFVSMEHTAHVVATLLILRGLQDFVAEDVLTWMLWLGVILSPALRLEGLAFALAAGGVVALSGRWAAGFALGAAALLPVVSFVAVLSAFDVGPLPNSVMAKLGDGAGGSAPFPQNLLNGMAINTAKWGGRALLLGTALALVALSMTRGKARLMALAVFLAGLAHLLVGQIGWLDRYEVYALVLTFGGVVALSQAPGLTLAGILLTGVYYGSQAYDYPAASYGISRQQSVMAEFVKEHVKEPVAVNDIGKIAWQNANYVLDLWGLANSEALELRLSEAEGPWIVPLAEARDVRLAMIYDDWLGENVGETWVRFGCLRLLNSISFLGSYNTAFYATDPAYVEELSQKFAGFAEGLPENAYWDPGAETCQNA
ncbi:MAG: hypothetical protein AAGD04_03655 [Pseudomonadota bacterium]